jgi:hypothetical protein
MQRNPVVTFYSRDGVKDVIKYQSGGVTMPVVDYISSENRVNHIRVNRPVTTTGGTLFSSVKLNRFIKSEPIISWHFTAEAEI